MLTPVFPAESFPFNGENLPSIFTPEKRLADEARWSDKLARLSADPAEGFEVLLSGETSLFKSFHIEKC
jgi:hypothetical protein